MRLANASSRAHSLVTEGGDVQAGAHLAFTGPMVGLHILERLVWP